MSDQRTDSMRKAVPFALNLEYARPTQEPKASPAAPVAPSYQSAPQTPQLRGAGYFRAVLDGDALGPPAYAQLGAQLTRIERCLEDYPGGAEYMRGVRREITRRLATLEAADALHLAKQERGPAYPRFLHDLAARAVCAPNGLGIAELPPATRARLLQSLPAGCFDRLPAPRVQRPCAWMQRARDEMTPLLGPAAPWLHRVLRDLEERIALVESREPGAAKDTERFVQSRLAEVFQLHGIRDPDKVPAGARATLFGLMDDAQFGLLRPSRRERTMRQNGYEPGTVDLREWFTRAYHRHIDPEGHDTYRRHVLLQDDA